MKYIISTLFLFFTLYCQAQIGDIKREIDNDISKSKTKKKNSSTNNSTHSQNLASNQISSQIVKSILEFVFIGIYQLQKETLSNAKSNPKLVSFESINKIGAFAPENGLLLAPHLRGNWGIISTDFRLQSIHDKTGTLTTQDWQVIRFNLPIEIVKISYGLGVSHLREYSHSYFEQTIRGEVRFTEQKGTIGLEYRVAKNDSETTFRKETNAFVDYELIRKGKFQLSPSIMISRQHYFNTTKQFYVGVGLNIRFF